MWSEWSRSMGSSCFSPLGAPGQWLMLCKSGELVLSASDDGLGALLAMCIFPSPGQSGVFSSGAVFRGGKVIGSLFLVLVL